MQPQVLQQVGEAEVLPSLPPMQQQVPQQADDGCGITMSFEPPVERFHEPQQLVENSVQHHEQNYAASSVVAYDTRTLQDSYDGKSLDNYYYNTCTIEMMYRLMNTLVTPFLYFICRVLLPLCAGRKQYIQYFGILQGGVGWESRRQRST